MKARCGPAGQVDTDVISKPQVDGGLVHECCMEFSFGVMSECDTGIRREFWGMGTSICQTWIYARC